MHGKKKIRKKFGFFKSLDNDDKVILEFLEILLEQKVDYTNAFRKLSCSLETDLEKKDFFSLFHNKKKIKEWFSKWMNRIKLEIENIENIIIHLKKTNPSVIPRNHVVENVINMAVYKNDFTKFEELISLLENPYDDYYNKQYFVDPQKKMKTSKILFVA